MDERTLSYPEAVYEGTHQLMQEDPKVVMMGLGVDDPKGILGTTKDLHETFGRDRVFDTPLSEDAMTGAAVGMGLAGLRPIHVHIRVDFLMLAMNQLVNMAAKMHYMFGGRQHSPITVRAIIGKSWGQGAQHSQALQSMLMHVPGLKVVMPATPYDAKGCLAAAVKDDNPVVLIEQRLLYYQNGPVPKELYTVEPGKSRIVKPGKDITIVGISYMQLEAFRATRYLEEKGIDAEVIDPIWLSPLDTETIINSVKKTGRLLIVDNAWESCGASAEIMAQLVEGWGGSGQFPQVERMGFAPVPCPTTPTLEEHFYPNSRTIASTAYRMMTGDASWMPEKQDEVETTEFKGPF